MSLDKMDVIQNILNQNNKKEEEQINENEVKVKSDYYPSVLFYKENSDQLYPQLNHMNRRYRGPIESEKENLFQSQILFDMKNMNQSVEQLIKEFIKINQSQYRDESEMSYIKKVPEIGKIIENMERKLEALDERMSQFEGN